eukprot:3937920-Rhodomonas_salina.3
MLRRPKITQQAPPGVVLYTQSELTYLVQQLAETAFSTFRGAPNPDIICNNCSGTGHIGSQCPSQPIGNQGSRGHPQRDQGQPSHFNSGRCRGDCTGGGNFAGRGGRPFQGNSKRGTVPFLGACGAEGGRGTVPFPGACGAGGSGAGGA